MSLSERVAARYKGKKILDTGTVVYEYSPQQVARRNNQKAERLEKLSKNIGKLRAQVKKDLSSSDPDKAMVALVISCIDHTAERIGNEGSAEEGHFGVTGWQRNHISFGKGKATVRYVGKSGVKQKKSITDKSIVKALRDAYEAAGEGESIFQHDLGKVDAAKVNAYLKRFNVTAKDLRGFHANQMMRDNLKGIRRGPLPEDRKEREAQLKKEWKQALELTANQVGHESSTLESQYLTPGVKDLYLKNGEVMRGMVARMQVLRLSHLVAARYADLLSLRVTVASIRTIDQAWVEKLRKDFLVLMKNLPRAKDYNTALELKEVSKRYQKIFYQWVFEEFLNPQKESGHTSFEGIRKPAWDFYIEFPLPLERANDYHSEEQRFYNFENEKRAWEQRIRRKAQILWKAFKTALTYTEKGEVDIEVPDVDRTVLEGFQTKIVGYSPRDKDWQAGALERMKESLRRYRRQASKTLPWLLQHQLPLVLNFKVELDKGATYEKDHIEVTMSSMIGEKVGWGVHMLAHEMGHHMFKGLSKGAQIFWHSAIQQDYGPIDLRELLSKWPPSMKWAHSFYEQMAEKEPVLALQVDTLSRERGGNLGWEDRERFQRALDSGEVTVQVPKHPITGYASKNPEEAFCEAVGLIVAYGPRAVPTQVRDWMETIIPGKVRLASRVLELYSHRTS